jgi:uncharacterized membrane protein
MKSILDSERSEGANGFTMFILFFIFSLLTNLLPKGVLRSLQAYRVSGSKLHLVGTLERSFFDFLNSFLMRKEKLPRIYEKTANIRFRQITIFHIFVISKIMN